SDQEAVGIYQEEGSAGCQEPPADQRRREPEADLRWQVERLDVRDDEARQQAPQVVAILHLQRRGVPRSARPFGVPAPLASESLHHRGQSQWGQSQLNSGTVYSDPTKPANPCPSVRRREISSARTSHSSSSQWPETSSRKRGERTSRNRPPARSGRTSSRSR